MLILGQKYTFTPLELERLQKRFPVIDKIAYSHESPKSVIEQIQNSLKSETSLIVLNTKAKVDNSIIKYLTNLQFDERYSHIRFMGIEHFLEEYLHKCYIPEDNDDLHYLDDIKPFTPLQKFQKTLVDVVAVVGLFIVFLVVKPFVKKRVEKESPGSLYFKQLRVGEGNREFECIKFRSMHEHNTEKDIRTATKDDDRVFEFGKFLRKTRLDEVPQLFNILKGDIHLIGPRAEWNKLVQEYENEIPYYNQRHIVKPGITGWAQVMYPYGSGIEDARQKLMYDLYYIKHWSLWLEIKVIYKTVMVVLGKKGI